MVTHTCSPGSQEAGPGECHHLKTRLGHRVNPTKIMMIIIIIVIMVNVSDQKFLSC